MSVLGSWLLVANTKVKSAATGVVRGIGTEYCENKPQIAEGKCTVTKNFMTNSAAITGNTKADIATKETEEIGTKKLVFQVRQVKIRKKHWAAIRKAIGVQATQWKQMREQQRTPQKAQK